MQIIETMTLNEVTHRLRALGVHTTEVKVAAAIELGLYPWGICIPGDKHRCFEIYTQLFNQWVEERVTVVSEDITA